VKFRSLAFLLLLPVLSHAGETARWAPEDYFFQPVQPLLFPVGCEVLFGPDDKIEQRILDAIAGAKTEVLVNHYILTNERIMDALKNARTRGCVVLVLLDATPAVRDYRGFANLAARKVPTLKVGVHQGHWNNAKYIIIDRSTVITGTADLTNASAGNVETEFVLQEPSIVIAFYNHFVRTAFPGVRSTFP
jgi:phosphatidylserine/phosphatidylglycerophosphate/cardiolipin synthase-like enzyme